MSEFKNEKIAVLFSESQQYFHIEPLWTALQTTRKIWDTKKKCDGYQIIGIANSWNEASDLAEQLANSRFGGYANMQNYKEGVL